MAQDKIEIIRGFKDRLKDIFFQVKHQKEELYKNVIAEQAQKKKREDTLDVDGKPYMDKLKDDAHRLINENAASWQEFPAFMTDLVHKAMNIARALWYDPIDITYFIPYRDEIGGVFVLLKDKAINEVKDFAQRPFLDDKQLATVSFTVNINPQGQFNANILVNGEADNDPKQELKGYIEEEGKKWAELQGYPNNTMSDAKFRELNADPENGLLKFLKQRFDVDLKEEVAPTSPSP